MADRAAQSREHRAGRTAPAAGGTADLLAELALAAACCRWPPSPAAAEAVRRAAERPIDWDRFEGVVVRNRINILAHRALERAGVAPPPAARARMARRAASGAAAELELARESVLLHRAFEEAGLPVMIVKGTPLALLAYGALGVKESWDIDLLTTRESAVAAWALLHRLGYLLHDPEGLGESTFPRFVRYAKEACFRHPGRRGIVELHWALVDGFQPLADVRADGPCRKVAVAGAEIRTLPEPTSFAYLCVHGTTHNWARLKWLADLGALLAPCSPAEVENLYRGACKAGAGRAAKVGLLLCHRLLDAPVAPALLAELRRDRIASALARSAVKGLQYRGGTAEQRPHSAPWVRVRLARLFLAPGPGFKLRELRWAWDSPLDRALLPEGAAFHLLRLPYWLGRTLRRIVARR